MFSSNQKTISNAQNFWKTIFYNINALRLESIQHEFDGNEVRNKKINSINANKLSSLFQ